MPMWMLSRVQTKFSVGDKVNLLRSDGTSEGPYIVATVGSAGTYTLSLDNGQAVDDGQKVMEDELVLAGERSKPDSSVDRQIRAAAAFKEPSCVTCRIRHAECDGARPHCLICTSTGRSCDGYNDSKKSDHDPILPQIITSVSTIDKRAESTSLYNLDVEVEDDVGQDKTNRNVPSTKKDIRLGKAKAVIVDENRSKHPNMKPLSGLHTACFKILSLLNLSTNKELGYEFSADDRFRLSDSHAALNLWMDIIQNGQLERCGRIVPEAHSTVLDLFTSVGRLILCVLRVVTDTAPSYISITLSSTGWQLITLIERSSRIFWPEAKSHEQFFFMSDDDNSESSDDDSEVFDNGEFATKEEDEQRTSKEHMSELISRIRNRALMLMDLLPTIEQILDSTQSAPLPDTSPYLSPNE